MLLDRPFYYSPDPCCWRCHTQAADVNASFAAALAGSEFGNYSDATVTERECIAVYG